MDPQEGVQDAEHRCGSVLQAVSSAIVPMDAMQQSKVFKRLNEWHKCLQAAKRRRLEDTDAELAAFSATSLQQGTKLGHLSKDLPGMSGLASDWKQLHIRKWSAPCLDFARDAMIRHGTPAASEAGIIGGRFYDYAHQHFLRSTDQLKQKDRRKWSKDEHASPAHS